MVFVILVLVAVTVVVVVVAIVIIVAVFLPFVVVMLASYYHGLHHPRPRCRHRCRAEA